MCQSLYFRFQRVIKRDNTSEETIYEAIIFGDRTEIFWVTKDGISCCTYIHTKRIKELIITRGSAGPVSEEEAYSEADIRKGLAERKARMEQVKEKARTTTNTTKQVAAHTFIQRD